VYSVNKKANNKQINMAVSGFSGCII